MELQERDYKILTTLLLLRIVSASQIEKLYFSSITISWRRLKSLSKQGYISTDRVWPASGNKWFNVYFLTKEGENIARSWLGSNYDRVVPDVSFFVNKLFYNHELLMVDVFVKLVLEKRLSIEDLFTGNFMDSRLAPVLPSEFKRQKTLRPDARFDYNGVTYWVEIDRETERTSIVEEKIKRYRLYFERNPGQQHTILFLVDGKLDWNRMRAIRILSSKYIGPHNGFGNVKWYTLPFDDLDFVVNRLIDKTFFRGCLDELLRRKYKEPLPHSVTFFNQDFLKSASTPACWLGFKDEATGIAQFYIVESIIGGQSGSLLRLNNFEGQYSEYHRKFNGEIKLIVIYKDQHDLELIPKMYPKLVERVIYVSVTELLNGECQLLLGKGEM